MQKLFQSGIEECGAADFAAVFRSSPANAARVWNGHLKIDTLDQSVWHEY